MNILGINGAVGWDGNIGFVGGKDYWVHGSGATLFIDGELKGSVSEERLTRKKYDGNYPKNSIQQLLLRHNLSEDDIDIVAYVHNAAEISYTLKIQGYTNNILSNIFNQAKIMVVDHHLAHASGSFISSGFMESNIFSFDGAGDFHPTDSGSRMKLNNSGFYNGNYTLKNIIPLQQTFLDDTLNMFGGIYSEFSSIIYQLKVEGTLIADPREDQKLEEERVKTFLNICSFGSIVDMTNYEYKFEDNMYMGPILRETHPGKIMGLAAYGDYTKIDVPEILSLTYEGKMPVIQYNEDSKEYIINNARGLLFSPEDLASWLQHQFETYLLLYLKSIPKEIKTKNLCLSGGCALNISTNSKIIEEGIYEDVHINTAPNDEGLNFGAACLCALRNEEEVILPENIGCIGFDYNNTDVVNSIIKFNNESNDAFTV
jgi:carbamoyltransferase